jgi:excisionase family DNA binding protein
MESFVTAAEVAKYLSLSPRTVAKMARERRIPAHPISGTARRTWRFKLSEVEICLAAELPRSTISARPGCSVESE